jgi:hypothetical protein
MKIRINKKPKLWFVKSYPTNAKKRTIKQKINAWRRELKKTCYRLDGQIAMW